MLHSIPHPPISPLFPYTTLFRSHVERERALRAVDLPLERVAATEGQAGGLDRPDRAVLELDRRLDAVVDLATGEEGLHQRRDRCEVANQVAGEVDHVRPEIAERTAAGLVGVEAPGVERGV